MSDLEALICLYGLPLVFWIGVFLYVRTLAGEVTQVQSVILFCLCFAVLASMVMLNVAVHSDLVLSSLAGIETITIAALIYFQIKKVLAAQ